MLDTDDLGAGAMNGAMRRCVPNLPPYRIRPRVRLQCWSRLWLMPTAAATRSTKVGIRNVPEPRMVTYQRVGTKGLVSKVEKAIREIGWGSTIKLNGPHYAPIPELERKERRHSLTQVAGQ